MAPASPNPRKQAAKRPDRSTPTGDPPEVVDPVWLLKGFALVVVAALVCGYLTVCLLFYQGQWQLVLHPKRSASLRSAIGGDPVTPVRFAVDESGAPQLAGLWLPAKAGGRYAAKTILYLPSGDGSLNDAAPRLATLHNLGINVFAFDYRGYGQSAEKHPDQARMTQDMFAAWQYLTTIRAVPGSSIIPYGKGVGGFLALQLAASQAAIQGVIVEAPRTGLIDIVRADPRTQSLPIRALFHDAFDIQEPLAALKIPKLFLLSAGSPALQAARQATDPKQIVVLPLEPGKDPANQVFNKEMSRFLDDRAR